MSARQTKLRVKMKILMTMRSRDTLWKQKCPLFTDTWPDILVSITIWRISNLKYEITIYHIIKRNVTVKPKCDCEPQMWLWTPLSPTKSIAFTTHRSNNHGYSTHRLEYAVNFIILLMFPERSAERKRKRRAGSIVILHPISRDCVTGITGWFFPIIVLFIHIG